MRSAALVVAALLFTATAVRAQEPAPDPSLDRMKAVLQHKPLNLTPAEPEATFKIEIHAIHPMHDIFEKPAWQLPPIRWHVPPMGPSTAFGSMPLFNVDLLQIAGAVKRGHDERAARAEVLREIAGYCAAQPNAQAIEICSPAHVIR
jgi:hypothetical protein